MIFDWPWWPAYVLAVAGLVVGSVRSRRHRWVFAGFAVALAALPLLVLAWLILVVLSIGRAHF